MKKAFGILMILCLVQPFVPLTAGSLAESENIDIPGQNDDSYTGECLIVRDETVWTADSTGDLECIAQEGAPVNKGDLICSVYSPAFSAREKAALQDCRNEVMELQMKLLSAEIEPDAMLDNLDRDLLTHAREIRSILHGARGNLAWQESQLKDAANTRQNHLREKYADSTQMSRLYNDENMQSMKISSWKKQVTAQESGIVSFYTDGYEKLTMDDPDLCSPDKVRNMINGSRPETYTNGTAVYRIVQNSRWGVLMLIRDNGWIPQPGSVYELRLDILPDTVPAKIIDSVRSGDELLVRLEVEEASVLPVLYFRTCKGQLMSGSIPGEISENSQTASGSQDDLHVLPCHPGQDVVPFMAGILYIDGTNLCYTSGTGEPRWMFPVEEDAQFEAGPTHAAVWNGSALTLIDQDGSVTYSDTLESEVQFVRIGKQYIAIVIGDDTAPKLIINNLQGCRIDVESHSFSGMMLLDAGFFGDDDQYIWTLSLNVFSMVPNIIINTIQVGKMNCGLVSPGESIAYRIIYENDKLRVFTTQKLLTFDYRCVQDTMDTSLLYGWQLIDHEIPDHGRARFLLAPAGQISGVPRISELRILEGDRDLRYILPESCIGACMFGGNAYAVSGTTLYIVVMESRKCFRYQIPELGGEIITAFNGVTSDGMMLVTTSSDKMYSLALPR